MPEPRPPRRRKRRLPLVLAVAGGLVVAVMVVAWLSLPAIVTTAFTRGAVALGFEEASVTVERADLRGLRATQMLLRSGGLEVRLEQGAVDYAVTELIDGQLDRVAIRGLVVTLDFTRPRRGLLPDAIADLRSQVGGGGELVWPVDKLSLTDTRLALVLPGGTRTIPITASAARQADGRVTFELRSENPDEELHVTGVVRTETMEGEVTIHRFSVQPTFILTVAQELGLFELPRDVRLESGRVSLTGAARLADGLPIDYRGRVEVPSVEATWHAGGVTLAGLEIDWHESREAGPAGSLQVTVEGRGAEDEWRAGPARLKFDLENGRVRGGVMEAASFAHEAVQGRGRFELEAGVPKLGGPAEANMVVALTDLETAAVGAIAPVELSLAGWTDRVTFAVPELRLADRDLAVARDLRATLTNPLDPGRALEGSVELVLAAPARALLPEGWTLAEPELPSTVGRMDFRCTFSDAGPSATVVVRSTLPRVRIATDAGGLGVSPQLEATIIADDSGASLAADLQLQELETPEALSLSGVEAAAIALELPRIRFDALARLAADEPVDEEVALTLKAATVQSPVQAEASAVLRHAAATQKWSLRTRANANGVDLVAGGFELTELGGEATVEIGSVTSRQVRGWLDADDKLAVVQELARHVTFAANLTANAATLPGGARAEWLGASFTAAPQGADGPPLAAKLAMNAGHFRMGPENLVQPALAVSVAGDLAKQTVDAELTGMIEGAPLRIRTTQHLARDPTSGTIAGSGEVELERFSLANSDIVSRWQPDLAGIVVSGTIGAQAAVQYDTKGAWDGRARLWLEHGRVNYPAQKIQGEGGFADVTIASLRNLHTPPGQRIGLERLTIGEIVARDLVTEFRLERADVLHIEGARATVFDGELAAEPFSLYFPNPDVALDLRMHGLDADQLVQALEIFEGRLTGRLRGRLPVGLLAGRPIIGEGFLELEEEHPATFSFDTGGLFTVGLPDRTLLDQMNRLPYELLEDGLRGLELQRFRVDLFRRDRPGTPVDISFAGVAHTRRADVPISIDVHVNGSMRDVIERIIDVVMR